MTDIFARKIESRFTPRDDDNPATDRTCAKLIIYPGEIKPIQVTEALKLEPTRTVTAGESRLMGRHEIPRVGRINAWIISSEAHIQSKDLRSHLEWLIASLTQNADALRKLQATSGVRMYVSCVWWSKHGGGGPVLWPEQMRGLSNLNLECAFSFAYYGEESGDSERDDDLINPALQEIYDRDPQQ